MPSIIEQLGETLTGKAGPVQTSSLSGKYVMLYFSGHWCGPCRGFTPLLAEFYKTNASTKNFEVVFVSSDRDEASFTEYYGEMPWLALPFADRQRKNDLSKAYSVSGIPMLIVLDKDGKLITTNARSAVMQNDVDGFPWVPPTIEQIIGNKFLSKTGEVGPEAFAGKYLGLYFSAHWCGPCRGFTPKLVEMYKKLQAEGKKFEIVFCSSDREATAFDQYYGEMPWLAVPFADRKRLGGLSEKFEVESIPTLVLLHPDLTTITTEGVEEIAGDPEGKNFPWLPKPVTDINRATEGLNSGACLIMALDTVEPAHHEAFKEALQAAAVASEGKGVRFVLSAEENPIIPQVRAITGLPEEPVAQVVLIDIPDNGGFYSFKGDITKESLVQFVSQYREKKLERQQLKRQ